MFKTLINAFKVKEVRVKMLITLGLLFLYILGTWIPVPGIDSSVFKSTVTAEGQDFLTLLSSVSGGALANGAILALGVSPYISSSIIIQLLTVAIPALEKLSKQGEDGRKKINTITRYVALLLAIAQAVGIVVSFSKNSSAITSVLFNNVTVTSVFVVIMLVAGAMFTVWLGEKITDIGVGNGLSLLIFIGILSSASVAIMSTVKTIFTTDIDELWGLLIFLVLLIIIFALIVFVDRAERRVPVNYAKQMKGRRMMGGQSTHIPLRVNGSGVMPIIFASAFITFPQLLMSIFWANTPAYTWYANNMGAGTWLYSVILPFLILFFAFFYSQISFKPEDVAKQIQENGGFITSIRPGKPTSEYLKKINNRIVLFGAVFLAFIALVPSLVFSLVDAGSLVNSFTATGMMIVVSVALELDKQIGAQMLMRNYRGFLK